MSVFSSVVHCRGVFGLGADAVDDLARLFEDRVSVEVVEIPAGGAGLLGELARLLVEGGERVAEENAARALRRALSPAEDARRADASGGLAARGRSCSSAWYSRCISSTAVFVPS